MKEVTDSRELDKVKWSIQNIAFIMSTEVKPLVHRAWLLSEGWYRVEMTIQYQIPLWGILFIERNELYLDTISMLFLVDERIQVQLDAFNAGKHWRYKGL